MSGDGVAGDGIAGNEIKKGLVVIPIEDENIRGCETSDGSKDKNQKQNKQKSKQTKKWKNEHVSPDPQILCLGIVNALDSSLSDIYAIGELIKNLKILEKSGFGVSACLGDLEEQKCEITEKRTDIILELEKFAEKCKELSDIIDSGGLDENGGIMNLSVFMSSFNSRS